MELLTGAGLASAAGLNAWLPLLLLGAAARWTDVVALPDGWAWLSEPGVLAVLAVLLVVEALADKVPGVDHVNDALQTVVRPLAGGVAASAGTGGAGGADLAGGDDASWLAGVDWTTVLAGAAVALVVHLLKAAGRAAVNAATAGVGAPVASAAEDALSLGLVASALLAPVLVLAALAVLLAVAVAVVRRRRRRRAVPPV